MSFNFNAEKEIMEAHEQANRFPKEIRDQFLIYNLKGALIHMASMANMIKPIESNEDHLGGMHDQDVIPF